MAKAADSKTKASGTTRNSRAKTTTARKTTPKKTTAATTRAKKAVEAEKEEVKTPAKKTTSRSTRKTTATKSTGTKTTSTRKTTPKAKTTTTTKPKATTSRSTAKRTSTKKTAETAADKPKTTTRSSRTKKAEETKTATKKPAAKKTTTKSKSSRSTASSKRKTTSSRSTAKSKTTTKPKTQTRRTPARKPKEEPKVEIEEIVVEKEVETAPVLEKEPTPSLVHEPTIEPAVPEESLIQEVAEHKAPTVDVLKEEEEETSTYGDDDVEIKNILSDDEAFDAIEAEIPDCIKFNDCTRFRYIEGENLIVKDRYDNKYRFWINHSDNEILEPEVELYYAILPFNHKKGDSINTKRLAILDNKYTGEKLLSKLESFSDTSKGKDDSDLVDNADIKAPDAEDRIAHEASSGESLSSVKGAGAILSAFHETSAWAKQDSKKTISIVSVLAFLVIALGIGGYEYHSNKTEFGPVAHENAQSGKQSAMDVAGGKPQYVNLSPSETHIKSLNTIISEINRIQSGVPVKGKVGSEILDRHFNRAQLDSLKSEIQKQVDTLIKEEGEMNAGMGPVAGKEVPFEAQEDRFGTSNVPPADSWSYLSGARIGAPPGSQNISDVKQLSEFGLKVH